MKIEPVMPVIMEGTSSPNTPSGTGAKLQPAKTSLDPRDAGVTPETEKAQRELVEAMAPFNVALKFSRDDETGTIVVEMIDQKSGETLQQIPNLAMLHVSAALSKLQGKLINCKA